MITFILTAIGMAIDVLVEALLPYSGSVVAGTVRKGGGDGKPETVKEWLRTNSKPSRGC